MHDDIGAQRVPQLARDLAAVSGKRISKQTVYSRLVETGFKPGIRSCTDASKYTRQSGSRRVFIWRGNGARFHPSYEINIDRFGGKEILVCGGIVLCSRTPLRFRCVWYNSQHCRDQILEAYIVRVHYFVRGGFVGYRSRASSKHLSPSSSGRRARFLGGQKGVALHLQAARVGVGSTKKPTRC
ncbi:hypothetical protein TNCV_1329591 [Trichonephila clavipes]|nr:hypothetical protein TNCV_1329591 [Trichonephila clavipes]